MERGYTLSVLICTYNRHELLAAALRALVDGSEDKPEQLIVVNGGDEKTDRVVDLFSTCRSIEVKLIKTVNKNLAASRNAGLPSCTADIVAMTDDDAQVFPDWVTRMKRVHAENPAVGAVGGAVIGANGDSLFSRIADGVAFPSYPTARTVRTLPGVNVSYKREVIQKVGFQDESLFRGEDVDYNWRVKQLGYEIRYDPTVRVLHHHRPTLRAFLNQYYMYGRAYYLVRRKWPEMYCVYPHALRAPRDFAKAINFLAAAFYEPLFDASRMAGTTDKLLAYPILLANQFAWRGGMLRERTTAH